MTHRTIHCAMRRAVIAGLIVAAAAGAPALHAQTPVAAAPLQWTKLSVRLPASSFAFPPGDDARLADGYCLICHSAGMVLRQPPLTQAQWLGGIQKMRILWGSPMPIEEEAKLAAYLERINGPATARPAPAAAAGK